MKTSHEKFQQEVVQSIQSTYPDWGIEPNDQFSISVEVSGCRGSINLDNLYQQVQLHPKQKKDLIQYFLSEFANVIGRKENPLSTFDAVKNKISLVARPTDFYSNSMAEGCHERLAFSLPILPDIALYWVVEGANTCQYISNAQYSKWDIWHGEVMWWAYENTCKAEQCMNTAEIGDVGILISTDRKEGTIAHLLYEPRNLRNMIHSARPDWQDQPYWVCIPIPQLMIVTREGNDKIIREIARAAQEHYGKALSSRIYVFSESNFTGEFLREPSQKEPVILELEGRVPEVVLPS
jgi:hypothetical protein